MKEHSNFSVVGTTIFSKEANYPMNKHQVLIALSYGDEGKGSWSEFFAQKIQANLCVRYNGGCQGIHYVHSDDYVHPASQFCAATLTMPNLKTIVNSTVPFWPNALLLESMALSSLGVDTPLKKIQVMDECPILTPAHNFLCTVRELLSIQKISTTGIGVRELMSDIESKNEDVILRARDLYQKDWKYKLKNVIDHQYQKANQLLNNDLDYTTYQDIDGCQKQNTLSKTIRNLELFIDQSHPPVNLSQVQNQISLNPTIFEPAQGTLLDRHYGFKPYVTSTCTTVEPALRFVNQDNAVFYGLLRAYSTRHGNGLLLTEDTKLNRLSDDNKENIWQGKVRAGWLDLVSLKYAISINNRLLSPRKINKLAISCLDQLSGFGSIKVCTGYHHNLPRSNQKYFTFDSNGLISGINFGFVQEMQKISLLLSKCWPEYIELPGWDSDITHCKHLEQLPANARHYLDFISEESEIEIGFVSVGPMPGQKIEA